MSTIGSVVEMLVLAATFGTLLLLVRYVGMPNPGKAWDRKIH